MFCRARKDDRGQNCLKFPSDQDIVCIHPQQGKKMFSFDKVFDMASTQDQVILNLKLQHAFAQQKCLCCTRLKLYTFLHSHA